MIHIRHLSDPKGLPTELDYRNAATIVRTCCFLLVKLYGAMSKTSKQQFDLPKKYYRFLHVMMNNECAFNTCNDCFNTIGQNDNLPQGRYVAITMLRECFDLIGLSEVSRAFLTLLVWKI